MGRQETVGRDAVLKQMVQRETVDGVEWKLEEGFDLVQEDARLVAIASDDADKGALTGEAWPCLRRG